MRLGAPLTAAALLAACAEVGATVDQANAVVDKASVCAEALGLADLNPLVDPERLRARAADKERRLRELATHVSDGAVKESLLSMADSYVEVQKERFDDLTIVTTWAAHNATRIDNLRKACT
jgi:hypothetical protein